MVGDRDVTADRIISAVSLLAECAAGVLSLGYPAAPQPRPRRSGSQTYMSQRTGGWKAAATGVRAVRGRETPRERLDDPSR